MRRVLDHCAVSDVSKAKIAQHAWDGTWRYAFSRHSVLEAEPVCSAAIHCQCCTTTLHAGTLTIYQHCDPQAIRACKVQGGVRALHEMLPICLQTERGVKKECGWGLFYVFHSKMFSG